MTRSRPETLRARRELWRESLLGSLMDACQLLCFYSYSLIEAPQLLRESLLSPLQKCILLLVFPLLLASPFLGISVLAYKTSQVKDQQDR